MVQLSEETKNRLRAVKDAILAEPELYNQNRFFDAGEPCGGACCIAGWAVWNDNPKKFARLAATPGYRTDWVTEAAKALKIKPTLATTMALLPLFGSAAGWPYCIANKLYNSDVKSKERAEAAGEVIEYFIEHGSLNDVSEQED